MKHLRTHQLKRHGDYWTIARTACGKEWPRKNTTTSIANNQCPKCLRDFMMRLEKKIKLSESERENE